MCRKKPEAVRVGKRRLTFSKINNKFNINKKLKDSDKSL